MRIRKNAKIFQRSVSTTTTSPSSITTLTKTHLQCQLNQSPWDIITFPPSDSSSFHFQEDEDFGFPGNGSFGDSIQSAGSTKTCMESEEILNSDQKWDFCEDTWEEEEDEEGRKTQVGFNKRKQEKIKEEEEEEEEDEDDDDDDVVLCCETDGKGWQCGRVVKKGRHKMCARHLKNSTILGGKQSDGTTPPPARRGRGRPRTKKKEPEKNPYEYYYYSGFGPLWGKKKGPRRTTDNATSTCIDDLGTGSIMIKHQDTTTNVSLAKSSIEDEGIDYMECDDDDDDDEVEESTGKKRGRKRIKARSLKSLM